MNRSNIVCMSLAVVLVVGSAGAQTGFDSEVFGFEEWQAAVSELDVDTKQVIYPFHASDDMVAWAQEKLKKYGVVDTNIKLQILQASFFDEGEFSFAYDQVRTLTAEEAFAARSGNCMSFTSLFVAMSRSLGIPTFLVSVNRQPEVIKDEGLVVVNRHVVAGYRAPQQLFIYDFTETTKAPYTTERVIDDIGASAIYHTNIGGYSIRVGDLEEAVRNLEIAVVLAPRWAPAWIDLGVARSRLGNLEAAFDAFQRALEVEPGNSSALVNLAKVYREQGRDEEADTAMRAAAEGARNPFTLIAMADAEMMRGNLEGAQRYLRRARWWFGKEPDVYDALARLARLQGDQDKADKNTQRAAELRSHREAEVSEQRD
jgi:Flp pilus assembly protein TadD